MSQGLNIGVVVKHLSRSLGAEVKQATEDLEELQTNPDYPVILLEIVANQKAELSIRQCAILQLKQCVKKYWASEELQIPEKQKQLIRQRCLHIIIDPQSKIRNVASVIVSVICTTDFPQNWPNLLTDVAGLINSNDLLKIEGGLRTLVEFASEVTDEQLVVVVKAIFPTLLNILSTDKCAMSTKTLAGTVYQNLLDAIITLEGEHSGIANVIKPSLEQFVRAFLAIIQRNHGDDLSQGFGLKLVSLKIFVRFVNAYPKMSRKFVQNLATVAYQSLKSLSEVYERKVVNEYNDLEDGYDSDGDSTSVAAYVSEAMKLFGSIAQSKVLKEVLTGGMSNLVSLAIGFMQITEADLEKWRNDPNEYIIVEEDLMQNENLSVESIDLLNQFLRGYDQKAVDCITKVAQLRLKESYERQKHKEPIIAQNWWKIREASIHALGAIAKHLPSIRKKLEKRKVKKGQVFDTKDFLENVVLPHIHPECDIPYLRARAVWCAGSFSSVLSEASEEAVMDESKAPDWRQDFVMKILLAVVEGLSTDSPLPVRLESVRAYGVLCEELPSDLVSKSLPRAFPLICELLKTQKDILHMTLETIYLAIRLDPELTVKAEEHVTPLLVDSWSNNVSDAVVTATLVEIIQEFAKNPRCLPSLHRRFFPVLINIIRENNDKVRCLIPAALDMVDILIQNTPIESVQALVEPAIPLIFERLLHSEDEPIIEYASQALEGIIFKLEGHIVKMKVQNQPLLALICKAIEKLVHPDTPELACMHLGDLLSALFLMLSNAMTNDWVVSLVRAVIVRLYNSDSAQFKTSMVIFLARLVHTYDRNFLKLLEQVGMVRVRAKKTDAEKAIGKSTPVTSPRQIELNPIAFVFSEWITAQSLVLKKYHQRVSLSALAKVLSWKDPKLSAIKVEGYPIVNINESKIQTRSRSKPKFTAVDANAKIASILLNKWSNADQEEEMDLARLKGKKLFHGMGEEDDEDDDDDFEDGDGGGDDDEEDDDDYSDDEGLADLLLSDLIDDQGEDDREKIYEKDKLYELDLKECIGALFHTIAKDGKIVQSFRSQLDDSDHQRLRELLSPNDQNTAQGKSVFKVVRGK